MVIDENGKRIGIFALPDALRLSAERGYDLVQVAENTDPPVCKLMDFGKFKYEMKKQSHDAKKKQIQIKVKEIKLRPATGEHDLNFKIEHIKRFLQEGNKTKITVVLRGREMMFKQLADAAMEKVLNAIKDVSIVESPPRLEGRTLYAIVAPQRRK